MYFLKNKWIERRKLLGTQFPPWALSLPCCSLLERRTRNSKVLVSITLIMIWSYSTGMSQITTFPPSSSSRLRSYFIFHFHDLILFSFSPLTHVSCSMNGRMWELFQVMPELYDDWLLLIMMSSVCEKYAPISRRKDCFERIINLHPFHLNASLNMMMMAMAMPKPKTMAEHSWKGHRNDAGKDDAWWFPRSFRKYSVPNTPSFIQISFYLSSFKNHVIFFINSS